MLLGSDPLSVLEQIADRVRADLERVVPASPLSDMRYLDWVFGVGQWTRPARVASTAR
jgi:hypothetical protein